MALVKKSDIYSHMYEEIVDEITRGDDTKITDAIAKGEGEVQSYLTRYDCLRMFGGTYADQFLIGITLNVVCWWLIKLSNPNINLELLKTSYDDAIKYLDKVQSGRVDPKWPLKPNDPATPIDDAGNVEFSSNKKRNNHY